MIQLRWIEVEMVSKKIGTFMERHLQYRTWQVRIDASGAITPLPAPIEWTEWQDVPTEHDAARGKA